MERQVAHCGTPVEGTTAGQPVDLWQKPHTEEGGPIETPQTSDEFTDTTALGPQWEWNHNPDDDDWSLKDRPGFLRLTTSYAPDLPHAHNTLTQQMQYRDFELTTRMDVSGMTNGQRAGLTMFGVHPSWIGVVQTNEVKALVYARDGEESRVVKVTAETVQLRMRVEDGSVRYSYSLDGGQSFQSVGEANSFSFSWWKASRPALFTFANQPSRTSGRIDIDWVRCHSFAETTRQEQPARQQQHIPES
jgi:beta-xylosidase